MRRRLPFLLVAIVALVLVFKDRLIGPMTTQTGYLGYVEGETLLIASPAAGRLVARPVQRGEHVARAALLFRIDTAVADAEVARAQAQVAEAAAQLENLRSGKREPEQEVVRAQRREAEAQLKLAELDLARTSTLVSNGTVTRVRYDQAASQVEQLRARVAQMKAQEVVADLGGRSREIEAAEAKVREVNAALAQAVSRQSDLAPTAPSDALVENTFFDVGEWVAAGQPVVSLLAGDKLKLRFFVPEEHIARARPGALVTYRCDGCRENLQAKITYVAPRAEFTPPVIYSESARRKLVFLVEAKPVAAIETLRTGLPVEVDELPVRQP